MQYFGIRFFICNILICLFVGVIIGLKRLLKRYLSARTQYHLWFIFLILLAIPFLPLDMLQFRQILSLFTLSHKGSVLRINADIQKRVYFDQGFTLNKMNDFAVSVSTKVPSFINVLLIVLWIIGILTMIILAFQSWKRLSSIEKSALPLQNPEVKEIFYDCLCELKIKRTLPVYSTAFLKSPITVGFIKPRIYVPIHLISDLNRKDMRFMLLHELQHYRHKDNLTGYFMNLAGILYWLNPLIWYALKEMRCDREIACDSSVLQILQETDYEAYGNTLINLAEKISHSLFPLAMGIGGSMKQMKRRVLNIASFKKTTIFCRIRETTIFLLIAAILTGFAPILSIYASDQEQYQFNDNGKNISNIDMSQTFGNYQGSFVLYDTKSDLWSIYNMAAASKRVAPDSTYKIYSALLGLESGIITADHSSMTWNREDYPFDSWEADQDLESAMHNSVNWYFQSIDSQAGLNSVNAFLQKIGYGNQKTGPDINLYWTDFSLKISPIEQVELLQKVYNNDFEFHAENVNAVKNAICIAITTEGSLYGKTGTGRVNGRDVNGWFIGYIEKSGNIYYFATNIQGETDTTGSKAAEITASILADLQIWN